MERGVYEAFTEVAALQAKSHQEATKPDLGAHVREVLSARYGSLYAAADQLEFPYQRLKKAVQRSSFSTQDLEILLPGKNVMALKEEFSFNFSRRADPSADRPSNSFDLYQPIEAGFRSFQRGVRDIDFSKFVDSLYENIGVSLSVQAMTLFCASSSQPLEWSNEQAQKKLAHALKEGGIIIYVMETDLIGTTRSDDIPIDDLDRQFFKFLDRLDDLRDDDLRDDEVHDDKPAGFVALVRVRKCAFCVPFQKPALFSCVPSDESVPARHHALTTIGVPEQSTGEGELGTAVLPLRSEVASAMRDYLIDLIRDLKKADPPKSEFHFLASRYYGERSNNLSQIIEKLEHIVRYR